MYNFAHTTINNLGSENYDKRAKCNVDHLCAALCGICRTDNDFSQNRRGKRDSTLATAIRTAVVLVMAWGMVFLLGKQGGVSAIGAKSWVFLTLSGLATGGSWLFYYKALQMGEASRVAPIDKLSVVITMILAFVVLHETVTVKGVIGGILIAAGTLFMIL